MKKRMLERLLAFAALLAVCLGLGGCGESHSAIDNSPESAVDGDSEILVAYFSWSGNGQQMARWIAEETGGDLFRIVPAEPYGEDFDSCADRAKNELDNQIRSELSEHLDAETMAQYQVVYIGFPVWWYDLPMLVWTFLEEYDLSGKRVIPFFSHNGSSSGANSLNRVTELAKDATVLADDALSLPGRNVADSENEVKNWARERMEAPAEPSQQAAAPDEKTAGKRSGPFPEKYIGNGDRGHGDLSGLCG